VKTFLSILLVAAAARAQVPETPASRAPRMEEPGPSTAGRGGTQAPGNPSAPAAAGRGRTTAPAPAGTLLPKDLKYPPLHTLQSPVAATFTLPNGMKLALLEDHDLPVVGGMALVRTGSLLDPPQQTGLGQLAGTALRTGGTTAKTGDQIDNLLENAAANVESAISESAGVFSFAAAKADAPAILQVFQEMLTQPGFRREKVDAAKIGLRFAVSHRNDNAASITRREFANLIYGKDSPAGRQQEYATIDRISRNDLRAFHKRYFFPANVTLGVWGDFDTAGMKASIEKLFADWTVRQLPVPELAKVTNGPSPGVFLAEQKDAARTFFTIGHLGGRRDDKDCAALEIMAAILGSGSQGLIAAHLRTKLSLPSDVVATWSGGYVQPGLFEISGSTRSTSAVAVIKAIQEEIDRIRTAEVPEDEWRNARDAAVNRLVFAFDSRAKLFAGQMIVEYYGYPKDYVPLHLKELESVTRADVLRVARQYLNPANLTVVVAANPSAFVEPLEKLGRVTRLNLAIPEARPEAVESGDAAIGDGKQILLQAQAAAGGAEKLAAVKDYTMISDYLLDSTVQNLGGAKIAQTEKWVAPATFRQEATFPAGRLYEFTDGKLGWTATPLGWGALAGAERSRMFGDLFRVYYRLLLSDHMEGRIVSAIDETSVQITDATGQAANVEFDPRTHLLKRVSYDIQQAGGATLYTEEVYDDFRDVGGVKVPFKITLNQGGRRFSDVVVKDYKINTGLNPLELARRPQ
jgi:zinc protease